MGENLLEMNFMIISGKWTQKEIEKFLHLPKKWGQKHDFDGDGNIYASLQGVKHEKMGRINPYSC